MESQTPTPTESNSNNSSQNSLLDYLNNLNYLEEPLVGMEKEPLDTPEKIRAFVQDIRLLRESRQAFKSRVTEGQSTAQPKKEVPNMFADFGNDDE